MSTPAKARRNTVLASLFGLCLASANAQPPSAVEIGPRAGTGRSSDAVPGRSILRCFQAGRLIHESAGQAPAVNDPSVHNFSSGDGQSAPVQVLDLHHAVCLLISSGAARP